MATTLADAVAQYRSGLLDAAVTAIADDTVQTILGNPGPKQADDIVSVRVPTGQIDPATITAQGRTREVQMTCTVTFSIFRKGGPEQDEIVTARAFDLFSKVEKRIRVDDITLGGVVRWCLCTGWDDLGNGVEVLAKGRLLEFSATFVAPVRLTNL